MRLFTDKHENKWASLTDKIAYMHNATPRLFQIGGKKVLVSPFQLFLRRPPPSLHVNSNLISHPTAQNYFKIETQRQKQIEKFVLDFHKKEKYLYQADRNKNSRPPKFSDLQKIIGAPFDPSSSKTRADLIDYIKTLSMTHDSDAILPPSLPPSLEFMSLLPESPPPSSSYSYSTH